MENTRWRYAISLILLTFLVTPIQKLEASCWSSTGGNGTVWMSGTITAGGVGVRDVNVNLQPESWTSGNLYAYESACTDSNGNFSFKKETSPASACYSSYTYGGTTYTYCNWRSAHCYKQCYADDTNGYYANQSFALEGYKIVAYPPWGSSLSETYGNCEDTDITINFDSSQTQGCALAEKNIIVRVRVKDDAGASITSGLTAYVSGGTSSYGEITSSFKDFYVSEGSYYVGAYCTNWQNCDYACITNANVDAETGDTIKEVTMTAKKNSATVAGVVSGSDGSLLSSAYLSVGNYDSSGGSNSCYSYGWDQTDSNGFYSVNMPPGNYTMWVSPPWNYGSSGTEYGSKEESIALSAGETLTKNVTLTKKDGSIAGTVKDSNGNPLANAWVSAWTYGDEVHDWTSAQTGASGAFTLSAIKGQKYNVNAYYWDSSANSNDSSVSNCSDQGMVTAEAPASDVAFTFAAWDHTVNFAMVDDSGNAVSSISGGGSIRPKDSSSDNWCGTWVSFDSGSATKKLSSNTTYILEPYTWGATTYDPEDTTIEFATTVAGDSTRVTLTMIPVDATVGGDFVDADGASVEPDSNYMSVYGTKGSLWRSCTAASSSYSCKVSKGKWCIGYWLDWNSGYASLSPGSSTSCIDVTAGSANTYNLTFLKSADIKVTVKKNSGDPVKWAWVDANAYKASDEGSDVDKRMYGNNGCSTNSEGQCTIKVGAKTSGTTYYLNAHRPWNEMNDENLTLPEEVAVTAVAGETVTADTLTFRELDGELAITATASEAATTNISANVALINPVLNAKATLEEDIVASAYVSCFSDLAGYAEATTDSSGKATVKCTSGDTWHCFGVNQLDNNLYISESAEASCVPVATLGATAVTIKLNLAGTIPDAVNQSWDAGNPNTVALTDNFSISFPSSSLGTSGETVSCTIQPDPIVPYQAGKRPTCFYGYDITCNDSAGTSITQFNADVTICSPLCDDQLALLDLSAQDVQLAYRDTSTDSYINLNNVTIDDTNNTVCGKTNHLTEFVIIGNGNLSGADGDSEDSAGEAERTGEEPTGETGGNGVSGGSGGCGLNGSPVGWSGFWWLLIFPMYFFGYRGYLRLKKVKVRTCPERSRGIKK